MENRITVSEAAVGDLYKVGGVAFRVTTVTENYVFAANGGVQVSMERASEPAIGIFVRPPKEVTLPTGDWAVISCDEVIYQHYDGLWYRFVQEYPLGEPMMQAIASDSDYRVVRMGEERSDG